MLSMNNFVVETMAISFVNDPVSLLSDIGQHEKLMKLEALSVEEIAGFARAIDPKADYFKSPAYVEPLKNILLQASVVCAAMRKMEQTTRPEPRARDGASYMAYRAFMELAPLAVEPMNGIVGRALWLWCMGGKIEKTFLATFHDQALRLGGVALVEKQQ